MSPQASEMRDLLMDLGIKDADVLVSAADANRDGVVDVHEFLATRRFSDRLRPKGLDVPWAATGAEALGTPFLKGFGK